MEEVNANNKDKKENKEPGRKEKTGDAIKRLKKGGTDLSLRILAFTIAVIVWFILSITQYPTVTKTIKDIRVEFNMAGTAAEEKGLEALNYKDITVDVEIKGMNYEIGNYDANDLIATVNLDSVTKEGKYMLDIDVRSVHTTDRCTVVSVTPETHEVEFDRITQKTLQVTAEAPLITAEDGYTLKDKTVSPAEITVEGPKKDLDKISSVSARISKSKKISEDTDMAADDLVFYDEDDAKADTSKFTVIGSSDYTVEFQVYKKKTINLNVGITGAPQDFDISSLPMSLSEDSISVITPHLDEEAQEDITVGYIPLSEIDLKKSYTFNVPVTSSEINQTGTDAVTVTFDSKGYASRTFSIDSSRIELSGAPANMDTTVETQRLNNITVYGPEDVVAALTDEDIYAKVDISDIHSIGSYSRTAVVYPKNCKNAWVFGTNEVQIVVSEQKMETDSSGESGTNSSQSDSSQEN